MIVQIIKHSVTSEVQSIVKQATKAMIAVHCKNKQISHVTTATGKAECHS